MACFALTGSLPIGGIAWVTGSLPIGGIAWVTGSLLVSHCKTTTLHEGLNSLGLQRRSEEAWE